MGNTAPPFTSMFQAKAAPTFVSEKIVKKSCSSAGRSAPKFRVKLPESCGLKAALGVEAIDSLDEDPNGLVRDCFGDGALDVDMRSGRGSEAWAGNERQPAKRRIENLGGPDDQTQRNPDERIGIVLKPAGDAWIVDRLGAALHRPAQISWAVSRSRRQYSV